MDNQADEEPAGPSVDSEDAEERILARRLRIQKRQEAQKKCVVFSPCLLDYWSQCLIPQSDGTDLEL